MDSSRRSWHNDRLKKKKWDDGYERCSSPAIPHRRHQQLMHLETAANPHSMTSWWVDAAPADPHSGHRDGVMLESPRTMWWVLCKGWRYWKIWLEDRRDWWATVLANLFFLCASLSWPPWLACSLLVSLLLSCVALNPRILAIWIREFIPATACVLSTVSSWPSQVRCTTHCP